MKQLLLGMYLLLVVASCNNTSTNTIKDREQESDELFDQMVKIHYQSLQEENNSASASRLDSILEILEHKRYDYPFIMGCVSIGSKLIAKNDFKTLALYEKRADAIARLNPDRRVQGAYYYLKGKNRYFEGKRDSALTYLLVAADYNLNSDTANYLNCLKFLAGIANESGDIHTVRKYVEEQINLAIKSKQNPLGIFTLYLQGAHMSASMRDTAKSIAYFDSANVFLKENITFSQTWDYQYTKGYLSFLQGRYKNAIANLDSAISYNPSEPFSYMRKAESFEKIGLTDSVLATILKLESLGPILYKGKTEMKYFLPLKIRYATGKIKDSLIQQYTVLMNDIFAANKSVIVTTHLYETEAANARHEHNAQISRQEKRTSFAIFSGVTAILICLLILLYVSNKRRKLQYALLQSQYETSKTERNRIAQELHDDLGANFTSINLAAGLIEKKYPDEKPKELDIILNNAQKVFDKLKEIVWSMNAGNDSWGNLILFVKRFADSFLEQANVAYNIVDNTYDQHIRFMDAFTRRRLFLAIKEMLNNTVKYANASLITISFEIKENALHIIVADDGKGFDMEKIRQGNGVFNIRKIIEDIPNSVVDVKSNGQGTIYEISLVNK